MIFSSGIFIFCFLPIVIIVYYSLSKVNNLVYQRLFLILVSLFFYGYNNPKYLLLIGISILSNYFIAFWMQEINSNGYKKVVLATGILFNIGVLGYFKYYNFVLSNINLILRHNFTTRNILLPLGISFYTFQQLSFIIDVYKGEEQVGRLLDYCLFVSFFPQLVAGPIVLYNEMMPQFADQKRGYLDFDNFTTGIYLFVIGLFKKVAIADTVSVIVDNGFGMDNIGFAAACITSVSYTLQIFFDFSGYSDMAVGIGKMFNVDFPFNFISPYKSESITEFWRRWHITLGRVLNKYVYIPLGGNRNGFYKTCVNLLITFAVSGIWHGADWTFMIWGVCHGAVLVSERLLGKHLEIIPGKIRVVITFLIVNFLWVMFRAENISEALSVYRGMMGINGFQFEQVALLAKDGLINFPGFVDYVYVVGVLTILLVLIFRVPSSRELTCNFIRTRKNAFIMAILFGVAVICLSRETVFIYYNF